MDRPLTVGNVHNMSLESSSDDSNEYPHLVAQFSCETEVHECIHLYFNMTNEYTSPGELGLCLAGVIECIHLHSSWSVVDFKVCCAAVWLQDMYNVTVKRIHITAQMSNEPISPVILKNVSDIAVQLNALCSLTDRKPVGIAIYGATSVVVHSSSANYCSSGLVLYNTTNAHINKITTMSIMSLSG